MAARVYVGGLRPDTSERELEDVFAGFGTIRSIWVARKPPGFAFVEFEDTRDAEDACKRSDGRNGWRVELSRRPPGGGGAGGGGGRRDDRGGGGGGFDGPPRGRGELRCYECNEVGHLARDCRNKGRARSPPRRRSPDSPPRRRGGSPGRRSPSPPARGRGSPARRRSPDSPPRRRVASRSRSPAGRAASRSPPPPARRPRSASRSRSR